MYKVPWHAFHLQKKNGTTGAEELITMSILKTHEG